MQFSHPWSGITKSIVEEIQIWDERASFWQKRLEKNPAMRGERRYSISVLTAIYIEALLVDEDLADQVWGLWDADVIDDELAAIAWSLLAS